MTPTCKDPVAITREQFLADLETLVAQYGPDHKYSRAGFASCVYFEDDGSPSCIIGHVMAMHGILAQDLDDIDNNSDISSLAEGIFTVDAGTVLAMQDAQLAQDDGATWGEALRLARGGRPCPF